MQRIFWLVYRFFFAFCDAVSLIWRLYILVQRRADLLRLVQWAKRKRLNGQERWYRCLLMDTERILLAYNLRYPRLYTPTLLLYASISSCTPKRYFIYKGAAAKYAVGRPHARPSLSFT
jgi:hypothetical protein